MENYIIVRNNVSTHHFGTFSDAIEMDTGLPVILKSYNQRGRFYGLRELNVTETLPDSSLLLIPINYHFRPDGTLLLVYQRYDAVISFDAAIARDVAAGAHPNMFPIPHFQRIMLNMLRAIRLCHANDVMHRAISPRSFLIMASQPELRMCLCNFSSARVGGDNLTPPTHIYRDEIRYRAPELLMGLPYTRATDIWSLGVSFAYVANFEHLFRKEDNNLDQLCAIFEVLGVPTQEERDLLPDYDWDQLGEIPGQPAQPMELLVPRLGPVGADLVSRMLELVPQRRLTVQQAMNHGFFNELHNRGSGQD